MQRFYKSLVFAVVMFLSIRWLGGNNFQALMLAAIPLVFGVLRVFSSVAYALTGLVFITAIVWTVLPPETRFDVQNRIDELLKGKPASDAVAR